MNNNKRFDFLYGFLTGFLVMLAITLGIGLFLFLSSSKLFIKSDFSSYEEKMEALMTYAKTRYLEDVDEDKWAEGAFKGAIESLDDPYSRYISAEEFKDAWSNLSGDYSGIGVVLSKLSRTGEVIIIQVYEGSPAEEAGLEVGDLILSADGFSALDVTLSEFITHVKGEENSEVNLTIVRDEEEMTVPVTRRNVVVPTISSEMLENNNAYIIINEFTHHTSEDFIKACDELIAQGADSLIIDLRGNTGGTVKSAVDILDYILPEGTIVYTEDKYQKRNVYTSDAEHCLDLPIVLLINEYSASSSEIFAGAIRDFDYGTLIGTKTYGKGIVQYTNQFKDGSGICLTSEYYYTPSGECIHKVGINPDIELEFEVPEDGIYTKEADNQLVYAQEYLEGNK
ncbi:MAG: PDZ domain-containing protein [Pseudobutyrivibrio sp.]|nr:PDZ domain-containing protein [Pseudobutyrivibrio sp.]